MIDLLRPSPRLQVTSISISISIFSTKIEKFYYRGENTQMYEDKK